MPIYNQFFLVNNQISPRLLRNGGPRVTVEVHISQVLAGYFSQRGQPVPGPISGLALFDTGASISAVDTETIANLGLNPVGVASVHTPAGIVSQNLYPVTFLFPAINNLRAAFNTVIGAELRSQGIIALVGRDFLSNCLMVYNGPAGIYSICI